MEKKNLTRPPDIAPYDGKPWRKLAIPVNQYGLDGKFIKTFASMSQASKLTKTDINVISLCCKDILKSGGGFQWRKA